jgi:hypothetical protein
MNERSSIQIENSVKISTLVTKKTLPPKQKKQYGSKYASKLKAKINISLSTNSLGMHNAIKSDNHQLLTREKLSEKYSGMCSEKYSEKRECSSANNDLLI